MASFSAAGIQKHPRIPHQESQTRALDSRKTLQKPHKRPSAVAMGFQSWVAYNLRFILTGDLCGACDTFGGLSAQLTHLGTVMNLAITENATIAQTYDSKIKTYAQELSKFRQREKEIIELLTHEGQRIKREAPRDCGETHTFVRNQKDGWGKGERTRRSRREEKAPRRDEKETNTTIGGKQGRAVGRNRRRAGIPTTGTRIRPTIK